MESKQSDLQISRKLIRNLWKRNQLFVWQSFSGILAIALLVSITYNFFETKTPADNLTPTQQSQSAIDPITIKSFMDKVVQTGVPQVYGAELDLSYDDISAFDPQGTDATIAKLAQFDLDLTMEGMHMERYINILYHLHGGMSCEYCCGVQAIIFENGEPACGCAHSYAMRGLTKYLIINHGDDLTDEEIQEEIGKWKVLFFPEIHGQKAAMMESLGLETDYISLTSNTNRGIEQGASSGGMVGGC